MSYISTMLLFCFVYLFPISDLVHVVRRDKGAVASSHEATQLAKPYLNPGDSHIYNSVLEDGQRTTPSSAEIYELVGDIWFWLGDFTRANNAYTQSIHLNAGRPTAFHKRGWLRAAQKNWRSAITDYTKSVELDPDAPHNYYCRGCANYELREYGRARADFESAWNRGLENPTAYALARLLAMCPEVSRRDGRSAIKYAKRAIEQKQFNESECLGVLAAAHAEAGDWNEAIRQGERAIQLARGSYRELLILSVELYRLREPYHEGFAPDASPRPESSGCELSRSRNAMGNAGGVSVASSVARTINPNPKLADIHLRLGDFFLYPDTLNALGHFARCIELDPRNPKGFAHRAEAYVCLGKPQAAMADAKSALSLSPKYFNARLAFVWSLASLGELNKALRELKELDDEFPGHPSVHLLRGHCYVAQKRYSDAVGELTEAIARIPQCPLGLAERAVALAALGKESEAKQDLMECGRQAPFLCKAAEVRIRGENRGHPGR